MMVKNLCFIPEPPEMDEMWKSDKYIELTYYIASKALLQYLFRLIQRILPALALIYAVEISLTLKEYNIHVHS